MDKETGVASPAGVLCPGGMELAGSEDSLFTCEVGSDGHSDVDVEGLATGFSGFLGWLPGGFRRDPLGCLWCLPP